MMVPQMSSSRTGVQARIMKESPLAIHTHCSGHCLNLVISHSSNLPAMSNVPGKMKTACLYFLNTLLPKEKWTFVGARLCQTLLLKQAEENPSLT